MRNFSWLSELKFWGLQILKGRFSFRFFLFFHLVFFTGLNLYSKTEKRVLKASVSKDQVSSKKLEKLKKSNPIEKEKLGFKKGVKKSFRVKIPLISKEQLEVRKKALNRRKSPLISSVVNKKIEKITYLVEKSKLDKAIHFLMRLKRSVQKRPYELAYVYKELGLIYLQKDQYDQAIQSIHQALKLQSLSKVDTLNLMFQLAHLYIIKKNYVKSLSLMHEWFYYNDHPDPRAYILRANSYYELAGYKKEALEQVEKALALTQSSIPRKRNWLQLGAVMNFELKKFSRASKLLVELVTYYPKYKVYWIQLAVVYSEMGKNDKALAILEMAYKLKFLSNEGELLQLVSLYLDQKAPLKAAQLLDREIKLKRISIKKRNLEMLANSYVQAEEREKALYFYQRAAALSKDGKLYFYLGQLYMNDENWVKADKAFLKALPMGGIKERERLYLSLGIVKYKMGKVDSASKFFKEALKGKDTKKSAEEWIRHLETEQESSSIEENLEQSHQQAAL